MKIKFWKTFKIINYIIFGGLVIFGGIKLVTLIYLANTNTENKSKEAPLSTYIKEDIIATDHAKKESYYTTDNARNYVWYNNHLFRIIKIADDQITLIFNDALTSLNWGDKINFHESNIDRWLNHEVFYSTFTDTSCLTSNYQFDLLTLKDYQKSGSELSFINNKTNFFIKPTEDSLNYINEAGEVGDNIDAITGIGVRPTINIKAKCLVKSGDGSVNNPYLIGINNSLVNKKINEAKVGAYFKYDSNLWRISNNDNNVKLVHDGLLKDKSAFGVTNEYVNSDIYKLIKNTYSNTLPTTYYTDAYGIDNNYDFKFTKESEPVNVTLLSIGDIFANNLNEAYFLVNKSNTVNNIMSIKPNGVLFVDDINSQLAIRPVIMIDKNKIIKSGDGTKINPFTVK